MHANILIVGVGSIGTRHLRNLLVLGYRDIALCDPSEEKLRAASRLGNVKAYSNVHRALKVEKPNIVFVCTPTRTHVPTASLALDANAHVFIEKPLSHTVKGIDGLIRKAKEKKRVVMVACNFRFHPGFQRLERVLRQKTFGAPLLARVAVGYYLPTARKGVSHKNTYAAGRKGGGVVLDSGAHVVDYLAALFGKIQSGTATKSLLHTIGIQSEEAAVLMFQHKSGIVSSAALDYVSRKPIHRIEVVTDKGILTLDLKKDRLTFEDGKTRRTVYKGGGDSNSMFLQEVRHFLKCVKDKKIPRQDIAQGRDTLRVLLAASQLLK